MTNKTKIAVICTGHARMVPQGWSAIWQMADRVPHSDFTVFSWLWDQHSDSRRHNPTGLPDWLWPEQSQQVFTALGADHMITPQDEIMRSVYQRFLAYQAIPPDSGATMILPFAAFARFMGQVLGLCLAMDQWRSQLSEFDIIVRSRWDMILDPEVIRELIANRVPDTGGPIFYTKYIDITHGNSSMCGDTIYGPAAAWLALIPSWSVALERIIQGMQQRWLWVQQNAQSSNFNQQYLQEDYAQGQWFSSHLIWALLFQHRNMSVRAMGDAHGIHPSCGKIPLTEFSVQHAIMGPDHDFAQSWAPPAAAHVQNYFSQQHQQQLRLIKQQQRVQRIRQRTGLD